jgi:hypothetical protein
MNKGETIIHQLWFLKTTALSIRDYKFLEHY